MFKLNHKKSVIQTFKMKTFYILIIIFSLFLAGILLAINLTNYNSSLAESYKLLSIGPPKALSDKSDDKTSLRSGELKLSPIYTIIIDQNKNYSLKASLPGTQYSKKDMILLANAFLSEKKTRGLYKNYCYLIHKTSDETQISFIDFSIWKNQQTSMILYSICLFFIGFVFIYFISYFLTGWLVKPILNFYEKQKEFISDASHELKTPLTVMKSSLELLTDEYGNNKYFNYIELEHKRMTELVTDMLSLSVLDNLSETVHFERFDISHCIVGSALPFESLAYEKGVSLELQIEPNIFCFGNEKQLQQMVGIFLDNAIKHTYPQGKIILALYKEKGKPILEIKNQGDAIPLLERQHIFQRFYKIEKSRNSLHGGYGLGLSIAHSIATHHKATIHVDFIEPYTIFLVTFPSKF